MQHDIDCMFYNDLACSWTFGYYSGVLLEFLDGAIHFLTFIGTDLISTIGLNDLYSTLYNLQKVKGVEKRLSDDYFSIPKFGDLLFNLYHVYLITQSHYVH